VVEVVRQAHPHAALGRADERPADDVRRLVVEAEVVEGEIEARPRLVDEPRDEPRDVERRLPPVGQRPELERLYGSCALIRAL
jgi:hypothetical protein